MGETVSAGGTHVVRYRYRTPVLTGPWRDSRDAALRDALGAKQARIADKVADGVEWLVPGEIEEERAGRAVARAPASSARGARS